MGGQLFGQGNRLTTAQLYTFEAHCKAKWSAHFDVIKTLIPLKDKATHGDLDLAIAWSRLRDHTAGKGLERGELNEKGEEVISDFTLVDKKRGDNVVGFEGDKGEDGFDFKAFIRQLVKEVGGRKWQRQGWQLFVEVPCKEIPGINLDEVLPLEGETQNVEPIYQLDIMMIHPASIDFDMFATSYRSTLRILSASIRNLSRSVSLHQTFLALRHLAYPGLRPVELVFTNSAEEFCDWVGLDYRFWKENHFANQTVFWEWLSNVEEDSILGKAYTRLVKGLDIPHKKKYKLKDTDWSEFKQYLHDKSKFAKYALSPDELAAKIESIALRDQEKQEEELVNPSFVDPNSPVPLDLLAKAALVRWEMVEDYEKELRQRKEEAMMLCFRQKKNPVKLLLPTAPTDGSSASVTDPLSKAADENVPPAPAKKGDVARVLVAEVDKGSQGGSSSG